MITAGEMLSKLDTARGVIAEADEDNESLESADGGGVKHAIDGQQAPVMACSRAASAPPRKMRLGSRRSSTAWSRRCSTDCRTRPGPTPGMAATRRSARSVRTWRNGATGAGKCDHDRLSLAWLRVLVPSGADLRCNLPDRGGAKVLPVGQVICQDVLAMIAAAMAFATERPWSLLVMTAAAFRTSTAPNMRHW
jgi:hypothetical protein